jgi:hypothetical protein
LEAGHRRRTAFPRSAPPGRRRCNMLRQGTSPAASPAELQKCSAPKHMWRHAHCWRVLKAVSTHMTPAQANETVLTRTQSASDVVALLG